MSAGAVVWLRSASALIVALVLFLALSPARPPDRLPWPLQPPVGAVAGLALALVVARRLPRGRAGSRSISLLLLRCGFLCVLAAGEEAIWRRVALGEILFAGTAAALAASTLAFALAHRARQGLHLLTGATFGAVYVATGALVASIVAHWAYNLLIGLIEPPRREPLSLERSSYELGRPAR